MQQVTDRRERPSGHARRSGPVFLSQEVLSPQSYQPLVSPTESKEAVDINELQQ